MDKKSCSQINLLRIHGNKNTTATKKIQAGYKEFLLSEMILAAMEEDDVSVRQLTKLAGVSPTIVQEMKSGSKESF